MMRPASLEDYVLPFAKTRDDPVVLEFPAELMGKLPFKYHRQQLGMPKRLMLRLKPSTAQRFSANINNCAERKI
jgi:hypothetical protein